MCSYAKVVRVDMEYRKRVGHIEGSPYWLLARGEGRKRNGRGNGKGHDEVLTVETSEGRILPLFGSAEAADSFLGHLDEESERVGWRVTESGAGELLEMLSGSDTRDRPCAVAGEVAFDPPEELMRSREPDVPTVGRRVFMDRLLGRGGRWSSSR